MARFLYSLRVILIGLALALGVLALGFIGFANSIKTEHAGPVRRSDGVVVLTGGTARLGAAVDLLLKGHAKRLLISGVNPSTTREELQKLFPRAKGLFGCCIDLDRLALNTSGNASETRSWAEMRGFKSLIVVTSSYHMPRTMVELRREMPGMTFTPYPVEPNTVDTDNWWSDTNTTRLLMMEYVKYVPALVRAKATGPSSGRRGDASALGAAAKRP